MVELLEIEAVAHNDGRQANKLLRALCGTYAKVAEAAASYLPAATQSANTASTGDRDRAPPQQQQQQHAFKLSSYGSNASSGNAAASAASAAAAAAAAAAADCTAYGVPRGAIATEAAARALTGLQLYLTSASPLTTAPLSAAAEWDDDAPEFRWLELAWDAAAAATAAAAAAAAAAASSASASAAAAAAAAASAATGSSNPTAVSAAATTAAAAAAVAATAATSPLAGGQNGGVKSNATATAAAAAAAAAATPGGLEGLVWRLCGPPEHRISALRLLYSKLTVGTSYTKATAAYVLGCHEWFVEDEKPTEEHVLLAERLCMEALYTLDGMASAPNPLGYAAAMAAALSVTPPQAVQSNGTVPSSTTTSTASAVVSSSSSSVRPGSGGVARHSQKDSSSSSAASTGSGGGSNVSVGDSTASGNAVRAGHNTNTMASTTSTTSTGSTNSTPATTTATNSGGGGAAAGPGGCGGADTEALAPLPWVPVHAIPILTELGLNTLQLFADVLLVLNKYAFSIRAYESVLPAYAHRRSSEHSALHRRLSEVCLQHGDIACATMYYLKLLQSAVVEGNLDTYVFVTQELSKLYTKQGNYQRAEEHLLTAVAFLLPFIAVPAQSLAKGLLEARHASQQGGRQPIDAAVQAVAQASWLAAQRVVVAQAGAMTPTALQQGQMGNLGADGVAQSPGNYMGLGNNGQLTPVRDSVAHSTTSTSGTDHYTYASLSTTHAAAAAAAAATAAAAGGNNENALVDVNNPPASPTVTALSHGSSVYTAGGAGAGSGGGTVPMALSLTGAGVPLESNSLFDCANTFQEALNMVALPASSATTLLSLYFTEDDRGRLRSALLKTVRDPFVAMGVAPAPITPNNNGAGSGGNSGNNSGNVSRAVSTSGPATVIAPYAVRAPPGDLRLGPSAVASVATGLSRPLSSSSSSSSSSTPAVSGADAASGGAAVGPGGDQVYIPPSAGGNTQQQPGVLSQQQQQQRGSFMGSTTGPGAVNQLPASSVDKGKNNNNNNSNNNNGSGKQVSIAPLSATGAPAAPGPSPGSASPGPAAADGASAQRLARPLSTPAVASPPPLLHPGVPHITNNNSNGGGNGPMSPLMSPQLTGRVPSHGNGSIGSAGFSTAGWTSPLWMRFTLSATAPVFPLPALPAPSSGVTRLLTVPVSEMKAAVGNLYVELAKIYIAGGKLVHAVALLEAMKLRSMPLLNNSSGFGGAGAGASAVGGGVIGGGGGGAAGGGAGGTGDGSGQPTNRIAQIHTLLGVVPSFPIPTAATAAGLVPNAPAAVAAAAAASAAVAAATAAATAAAATNGTGSGSGSASVSGSATGSGTGSTAGLAAASAAATALTAASASAATASSILSAMVVASQVASQVRD